MTRILGRVSSVNVRKVLWTLDELGVAYEREDWGLPIKDPKVPEFLALNPNGTIPVMVEDDGFTLWESNAIVAYLAQKHGRLMPSDPKKMGVSLQWLSWQGTELSTTWSYAVFGLARKMPAFSDSAKIAESIARWTAKMEIVEEHLQSCEQFISGDTFSVADIAITLSLHRWFNTPFDHTPMPAAEAYYNRLRQRPAGARWMPEDIV